MQKYGVQLYGLRDIATEDIKLAIKAAANAGYKYVEFAGFFDRTPEQICSYLDEYGVEVISSHTVIEQIKPENLEKTIEYHRAIGNKRITMPFIWMNTREDLERSIEVINYALPILKEAGITLSVHNHSGELLPTEYGVIPYDEIEARTDINFQLDTFWVFFAGKDPVALMEYYHSKGRLDTIHLKDGLLDRSSKSLGDGIAPVEAVLTKALELGIPIIVESEGLDPSGTEENARCFEFLKNYHLNH